MASNGKRKMKNTLRREKAKVNIEKDPQGSLLDRKGGDVGKKVVSNEEAEKYEIINKSVEFRNNRKLLYDFNHWFLLLCTER